MAQIRSSSAELIAFFETGDIPTADNFSDLIQSFAVYDGTLPLFSGSAVSTGSFGTLNIHSLTGSSNIILQTGIVPDTNGAYDIGSKTLQLKNIFTLTASIGQISSSIIPNADSSHTLGSSTVKFSELHVDTIPTGTLGVISSSLIPDGDDNHSLGTSDLQWKDLHLDGIANIDLGLIDSASVGVVSSSLIPDANNHHDLGSATVGWKNLYVSGTAFLGTASIDSLENSVSITGISSSTQLLSVSASILPNADGIYDLGTTAKEWRNLFISGTANINSGSVDVLTVNSTVSSSLVPDADGTYNLGSPANQWEIIYADTLSGSLNSDNIVITSASLSYISGSSDITIGSTIKPDTDNTHDLGNSSLEWKDLYVSGTAYIGNISAVSASFTDNISSSLIPTKASSDFNLGTSGKKWNNAFIGGTANIEIASVATASLTTATITTASIGSLSVAGNVTSNFGGFVGGMSFGNPTTITSDASIIAGYNVVMWTTNLNPDITISSGVNYTVNTGANVRMVNMDKFSSTLQSV